MEIRNFHTSMLGGFRNSQSTRNEFLSLIRR